MKLAQHRDQAKKSVKGGTK